MHTDVKRYKCACIHLHFPFGTQRITPWCSDPVARGRKAIARSFGQFCQPCELRQIWACQEPLERPLGASGAVCPDPLERPPGASGQVCHELLERPGASGAICQEPPPLGGHNASSSEPLPGASGEPPAAKGPKHFLA